MRNRLTKRYASKNLKAESQADGLFPGDVGNMERSKNYHDIDEYHTFEQTVNHELPDMRHEWKDNPRTETGHGIPKVAKVYLAAKQATKLAMMFLGEDANDDEVEAQAKDFMRMGSKALTASVNRWVRIAEAECEDGEAGECDETKTAEQEEAPAEVTAEETVETAPAPAEETPAEACENKQACGDVVPETAEETAETACQVAEEAPAVETPAEEAVAEKTPVEAEETDVCAEEEEDEEDVEVDETETPAEVDFDEADEEEPEADPELTEVFEKSADEEGDDNEVAPVEEAPVAKKSGIKRIAGQPKLVRVAKKAADELEGLWDKWESPSIR